MFRILNICTSSSWGEIESEALRWASVLASRGNDVTTAVSEASRLSAEVRGLGLKQITLPARGACSSLRTSLRIRSFLRRHEIDVIQLHDLEDLPILYWALLGWHHPKVIYAMHVASSGIRSGLVAKLALKKLSGTIVPSEFARRQFGQVARSIENRVWVIPPGLEVNPRSDERNNVRQRIGASRDDIVIGCMGWIDRWGGQLELFEAVRMLLARFNNLKLVIAGEPSGSEGKIYLEFLKCKATEHRMEEVVAFFADEKPQSMLGAFDIFVCPAYESISGRTVAEAMLAGLPCIGTDSGALPEVLDGGSLGILVEPGSVDSLARGLHNLIANPALRDDLATRSRSWAAEKFRLDRMLDAIENVYAQA